MKTYIKTTLTILISGMLFSSCEDQLNQANLNQATEDTFLNCVYAMAKAINPDIDEDALKEAVDEAIATPDKEIINNDTMFRYDSEDISCTISY